MSELLTHLAIKHLFACYQCLHVLPLKTDNHSHFPSTTEEMEKLDINIALDIVSRVGEDSFKALGGMLLASKFYHYLASHPIVLNNVSLQPFLADASLINEDSIYRPFFRLCLDSLNPTAAYLESIRLAAKLGRAEDALRLLYSSGNSPPQAWFSRALLEVCLGFYQESIATIDSFISSTGSFRQADAIGSTVFKHIMQIGPVKIRSHANTWHYGDIPTCFATRCRIDRRCRQCFLYWFSVMYLLLC